MNSGHCVGAHRLTCVPVRRGGAAAPTADDGRGDEAAGLADGAEAADPPGARREAKARAKLAERERKEREKQEKMAAKARAKEEAAEAKAAAKASKAAEKAAAAAAAQSEGAKAAPVRDDGVEQASRGGGTSKQAKKRKKKPLPTAIDR
jgi:colicin import membrane protein